PLKKPRKESPAQMMNPLLKPSLPFEQDVQGSVTLLTITTRIKPILRSLWTAFKSFKPWPTNEALLTWRNVTTAVFSGSGNNLPTRLPKPTTASASTAGPTAQPSIGLTILKRLFRKHFAAPPGCVPGLSWTPKPTNPEAPIADARCHLIPLNTQN